jgi:hypothetical protein
MPSGYGLRLWTCRSFLRDLEIIMAGFARNKKNPEFSGLLRWPQFYQ